MYYKAINNHRFSNDYAWRDLKGRFEYIKDSLSYFIAVEKVYAGLSLEEKEVLNYIQSVAAYPLNGNARCFETHTNLDLHLKLGLLGVDRAEEIW
ncbi:hypothetical protein [Borrelia persica]|uniref:hypothetical protein n=1 Tax=Borrelia persica TaxID=44448 RepID=UPI0004637C97|nr:hypothetical protein [Borrelia persica]